MAVSDVELQAALERWSETTYGLEDPLDAELVLASATALCRLAKQAGRAEELHGLLQGAAESFADEPHPDLALALAQGWLALLVTPHAQKLALADRIESLGAALHAAQSIDVADSRDAFGCAVARNLYVLLREAGKASQATEVLEQALARFPLDPVSRPWIHASLADDARVASSWERAWEHLEQARRLAAERPEDAPLQRTVAAVGCNLELAYGLFDLAAASLAAERAAAAGSPDPESKFSVLLDAAGVAMALLEPRGLAQVLAELDGVLVDPRAFAERPSYRAALRARRAMLAALQQERDPSSAPRAAEWLEEAYHDPELDATTRMSIGLKRVALALRAGQTKATETWIAALDELTRDGAPQAELGPALSGYRALLPLARGAGRAELEEQFRDLSAAHEGLLSGMGAGPRRAGGVGWRAWRDRGVVLSALVELSFAIDPEHGAERALELTLRQDALGSLARRLACPSGDQAGDLAAVRRLLRPGIGLLAYLPAWGATRLVYLDAERVLSFPIPWRYELESQPRRLVELLSTSPRALAPEERKPALDEIEELARELGERLIPAAVRARLDALEGVYVVGSELLGSLRFECFPLGGKPLGMQKAIAYLPSLSVGLELARRARAAPARDASLVLVAAPDVGAGASEQWPQLVPFELEGEDLDVLTRGFVRSTRLTGAQASLARLRAELGRESPAVLHFLVHGVSDFRRELSGALALAPTEDDDGLLWCERLFALDLASPPLVLLSSCGSARGPRRAGDDGLAQLGGAFLSRGARCIVEATSDVALAPTIRLTAAFGREVAAGRAPALAMRTARLELTEEPELAHPFYALSLRVVGLGFEPVVHAQRAK